MPTMTVMPVREVVLLNHQSIELVLIWSDGGPRRTDLRTFRWEVLLKGTMASVHDRALSIVYRRGLSDGHLHDAQHGDGEVHPQRRDYTPA